MNPAVGHLIESAGVGWAVEFEDEALGLAVLTRPDVCSESFRCNLTIQTLAPEASRTELGGAPSASIVLAERGLSGGEPTAEVLLVDGSSGTSITQWIGYRLDVDPGIRLVLSTATVDWPTVGSLPHDLLTCELENS